MAIQKKYLKSRPVCKVTFTLPKEARLNGDDVYIVGDFNNWDRKSAPQMQKLKNGSQKAVVDLECGREYQFRYLINNETWENDWSADKYVPSPYYGADNSVVIV